MPTGYENEITARKFYDEVWSRGDLSVADDILEPDFKFVLSFTSVTDREAFKELVSFDRGVFQGLTYTCEPDDLVADATRAAAYWTMHSRHVADWRKVPASHKDVSSEGMSFFRFSPAGRISEVRVQNDVLGLMTQIGGVETVYGRSTGPSSRNFRG